MAAKISKPARTPSPGMSALRAICRPQTRGPLLVAALVLAVVAGVLAAWNRWGAPATRGADYTVTPEQIRVTPQPEWIHSDVKSEVIRAANLSRLDLSDRRLVEQVAGAFALHAWVAKVVRVEKRFPAELLVTLEYRRPVAAVEFTSGGRAELFFVDAHSVLLPSTDFAQGQAKDFLRIAAGNSAPASIYGSPWGDERIAGAARIAAAWGNHFKTVGLHRIVPSESAGGQISYELRTTGDTRVEWGQAPGQEASAEPSPEQKVQALLVYVADKGPLDRDGGERLIDLRKLAAANPRTAEESSPPRR